MYADDTSLCYKSVDINQPNEVINNDLEKPQNWLIGNKLSLKSNEISFNAYAYKTEAHLIKEFKATTFLKV